MTARHALVVLEHEGIVERRRRLGTFVSGHKVHFNKLMSYSEQMTSGGFVVRSKILFARVVDLEQEISVWSALPASDCAVKLQRLRFVSDQPMALETCYLPGVEFADMLSKPLSRESLFRVLERDHRLELTHADEEIDATTADSRTAKLLGIQTRAPLLRIRQIIYSTAGKPVIYGIGLYRSDRHTLLIRRFR